MCWRIERSDGSFKHQGDQSNDAASRPVAAPGSIVGGDPCRLLARQVFHGHGPVVGAGAHYRLGVRGHERQHDEGGEKTSNESVCIHRGQNITSGPVQKKDNYVVWGPSLADATGA